MEKPAGRACAECPARTAPCVLPEPAAGRTRLVVIGENPGRAELADGRPFVGGSGRIMKRFLKRFGGYDRKDIHWTHAILCDVDKKDLAQARKCCATRLHEEIRATNCETALALGSLAIQSAIRSSRKPAISKYRGSVLAPNDPLRLEASAVQHQATVVAAMRPEDVMWKPLWAPVFETDVERACRISRDGWSPPERRDGAIVVPSEFTELKDRLQSLGQEIVVDIETTGLDIHTVKMTCLVIADTSTAVVIPISKTLSGDGRYWNGHHDEVIALINETMSSRVVTYHNGVQYDQIGLMRYGIAVPPRWDDTLLAYHAITSHFPKGLDHVVTCYEDVPPWKRWDHGDSLEKLWAYCGRDGLYNARAKKKLFASMDADDFRVYEHDKENAVLCQTMSLNGFMFDRERATTISAALKEKEESLRLEAAALTGMPDLNLLSPLQLREAFFKKLGAHVCFRSKSGAPSLGKDTMRAYAASSREDLARMALLTLEYRNVRKCRATYVDNVKPHADGRIHSVWLPYGTISGRWSAQKPNLANLPKPQFDASRKLGGIRSLYTASEGRRLVSFDIKQAEFRIAAYLSGDPNMISVCESGQDIHWMNACTIFGLAGSRDTEDKVKEAARSLAKNAVFAVCYLAEAATVHGRIIADGGKSTLQQVEAMLGKMRRSFDGYYEFQAESLNQTIRRGYVESPILGRKRHLGHAPSPTENANFPIQSGAADAMNLKLQKIEKLRIERRIDGLMVSMVYDSCTWDTREEDVERMQALVTEVFAEPVIIRDRSFELPIDLKSGHRWSDC